MQELSKELYKKIKDTYESEIKRSSKIKLLLDKMSKEKTNYQDAMDFSIEIGKCLERSFSKNISASILPDEKMQYNLAKEIIEPILKENYSIIAKQCMNVQVALNKAANIGFKAIKPEYKKDKTDGIINYVSSNKYDKIEKSFIDSLSTNSKSIVDDSVRENADFHYKSGLSPKIVRRSNGKCCKWCQEQVGVYDYKDVKNKGNDVFRRHANCNCTVTYDPGEGSKEIQDVWSKKIEYKKNVIQYSDKMGKKSIFDVKIGKTNNHLITYKKDGYKNIYCQTNTNNAQDMCKLLDEMINKSNRYGDVNNIVIVKQASLQGIACYDHINNNVYFSEELINKNIFKSIVDENYFPAKNIRDILNHELGGHKKHWDAIKKYASNHNVGIDKAKDELESNLRKYIINQKNNDIMYIRRHISENAEKVFEKEKTLNELIADVNVLYEQNNIEDEIIVKLVKEVLNYDG